MAESFPIRQNHLVLVHHFLLPSGMTAHRVSKYRPACPVICTTSDPRVWRKLLVCRSAWPFLVATMRGTRSVLEQSIDYAKQCKLVTEGDKVVLTSGFLEAVSGSTNMMKIHTVGDPL